MNVNITFTKFEEAMQILQHAACHWRPENLWKILYSERDYPGDGHDRRYVDQKYKEFQASPLKFFMGLDLAEKPHFFAEAKKSLSKTVAEIAPGRKGKYRG